MTQMIRYKNNYIFGCENGDLIAVKGFYLKENALEKYQKDKMGMGLVFNAHGS